MARSGLATTLAVLALAATACTLPEAPERQERTNAEANAGQPHPSLAPHEDGAPEIEIVAKENSVDWVKEEYEVEAGVVNIAFTSPPSSNHNLNLVGPGAPYPLLWGDLAGSPADKLTHAVELRKGTYTFYCSVPGHRQGGMEGRIVVS